jgi:hypothetical protein
MAWRIIFLSTFMFFLVIINSNAQVGAKYSISGFIYDETNGETLIGANVYLKELQIGNVTNNMGYFIISNVPGGKFKLLISYVGYKPEVKEISVNSSKESPLKIYLKPEAVQAGEIVVSGDSVKVIDKLFTKPVSKIELNSKQVNQIPQVVEADLLRSLQTMPGITSLSDFSSALYVRGGTPDQNLYLVDGTDVYNPEHAFGIFSTFNTNAIKKVEVSKGGFGAEYGGRLSSVLNVTNLDGNRNNFEGTVNISLLSGSTTLQIPLGSIGSISGSFRRTYIDQTYAKWSKDIPDYYFYDANLKGFFDLGDNDKLTVSYFGGQDNLDYKFDKDAPESFRFLYDWGNTTGSVNWKHIFNSKLFTSLWVTGSKFESNFTLDQIENMKEKNLLTDYSVKGAVEYYASNELLFKLGIEHKRLRFLYKFSWNAGLTDIDLKPVSTNAYISTNWRPNPLWDIEAGVRYNYFREDRTFEGIDPRFSIKYRLSETSNLKFAAGMYHQYMNRIPRLFIASIWTSADKHTNDSKATHFILSYQKQIGNVLELEAEVYYKDYKDIYIYNQNIDATFTPQYYNEYGKPVYTSTENVFTRGDGHSYGFEILLRKDVGAVTGWLSYSLAKTQYKFDGINQEKEYAPRHDRGSVINLVLNSDINSIFSGKWNEAPEKSDSKWLVGLNFIYASGQPLTVPASAYYVNTLPDWNNYGGSGENLPAYKLYPGEINSYRLPAYVRMDLSITYEKNYGSWSIAPYLQIFNIGNRKNVWFIDYKDENINGVITQKIDKTNMLPMLPSIGVTIKF